MPDSLDLKQYSVRNIWIDTAAYEPAEVAKALEEAQAAGGEPTIGMFY